METGNRETRGAQANESYLQPMKPHPPRENETEYGKAKPRRGRGRLGRDSTRVSGSPAVATDKLNQRASLQMRLPASKLTRTKKSIFPWSLPQLEEPLQPRASSSSPLPALHGIRCPPLHSIPTTSSNRKTPTDGQLHLAPPYWYPP